MAKLASSYWQRFTKNIPFGELPQLKTKARKAKLFQRKNPAGILWFLTIVVAMLLWNPKLLFSCSSGILVMLLVYSMPQWDWSQFWHKVRNYLQTTNGVLVLSVTSGAVACLGTYTATTIWAESPNVWIAGGAIVQGLATLMVLVLLARLLINLHGNQAQLELDQLLGKLTDTDPLKRLIGLRQLTKLAIRQQLEPDEKKCIIECLQLLITNESEATIRDAAFDSLQALEPSEKLIAKSNQTTLIPFSVKAKNHISC